jgi:hypothetical protein
MKYFKIRIGFGNGDDRYIGIDETELESALYCFISNSKGIFKNGVCRGQDIISITEDWHKEMGWNPEHNLGSDDWNELKAKGISQKYIGVIGAVKEKVQYLISTGRTNLIGRNADIQLPEKQKELPDKISPQ